MASKFALGMENPPMIFTIGHHDKDRPLPITDEAVASAHASGYDILTSPITTPHFQSKVLTLLSDAFANSSTLTEDITSAYNASPIVVPPLEPADTPLSPDETISQIIGITASWIDLESPDPIIADISRQVLQLELAYAAFCGLTYVIIPGPRIRRNDAGGSHIAQYARAVLDALSQGPFMTIYIWLPMIDHSENSEERMGDLGPFARSQFLDDGSQEAKRLDVFGTWQAWDMIRSICRYSTRLCVALSLPKLLPPTPIQSRWFSEPVRILTVSSEVFIKNPKGYPVLSKAHQAFVFRFVSAKQPPVWFLLSNVGPVPTSDSTFRPTDSTSFPSLTQASKMLEAKDSNQYLSYVRNLQTKLPSRSPVEVFGAGYQDYLQAPLQPLTVNLESITYEVFEKDPVKYEWYERAVARALHDWIEEGKPTSNPDGRVVVAVVGAGRGPLVTRALQASEAVGVEIDMWALEKNPNAFVLLQRHNQTKWEGQVNLVKSDMRTWRGPVRSAQTTPVRKLFNLDPDEEEALEEMSTTDAQQPDQPSQPYTGSSETDETYLLATGQSVPNTNTTVTRGPTHYKIDILISELLGSFADNELSPECLDGVQHLLNPTHGISIPESYTAHITPVAAPKLHADISLGMMVANPTAAEIPYVVMLNAVDFLSTYERPKRSQEQPATSPPSSPKAQRQSYSSMAQSSHHNQTQSHSFPITSSEPTPIIHQTWAFHHPNPHLPSLSSSPSPTNTHNARHSSHTFPIHHRSTCHGLAGYFESILYPGVELSTNPLTMDHKSKDMISWFPIYFPLKTPLHCPDNSTMTVQMWRRTDDRKVWYEWIADVFVSMAEDSGNSSSSGGGNKKTTQMRKVRVGGSGLHSSEKEACLM